MIGGVERVRYVIGCRLPDYQNITNTEYNETQGLFGFGKYGFAEMVTFDCIEKYKQSGKKVADFRIPMFEDLDSAQEYVTHLSKGYYKEFHQKAKRYNLDVNRWGFYLLKWDSSKFSDLKLEDTKQKLKKRDKTFYNAKLCTVSMR